MKAKIKHVQSKIKIRETSDGKKASLSYILFVLLTLHVVLLTSLTACGRKGPPVPPKESESLSDIRLQIANVIIQPFYKMNKKGFYALFSIQGQRIIL